METELKMLVDEADLATLEQLPLIESVTVGQFMPEDVVSVYFDTPDLEMQRAGLSLRVRHIEDRRLQTLKASGRVDGGLHQRAEWECEIDSDKPDLVLLRELVGTRSPHAKLLATPGLAARLAPVFTTTVRRTVRNLRLPTGEEVEMAIDRGEIAHEDASEAIAEFELELKSGIPTHLYTFALELLEFVPMRIGTRSKAERGFALRQPKARQIVKAAKLHLQPSMTVEEAFEAIVANCLDQVYGNLDGVVQRGGSESVHQMRVGLRRLRSALDLFKGAIECPAVMQAEWKWLAAELGAARDWEVLGESTLPHIGTHVPADIDVAKLKEAALEQARKNREEARKAVNSPRHTRLQLQFSEWMTGKGWRSGVPGHSASLVDLPLKKFARQVLKHGENRLLKRGKRLKDNNPESRHRVRIAGKKARYATEFFESLYPKSRVKDYVAHLSDLQQELGWLNDAAVAIDLLGQLQRTDRDAGAGFARGYMFACIHRDNPHLTQLWNRFTDAEPPYK